MKRKIIHFDMDAFYASIEVRDDPRLRGRPVIVGGSPESRAVVCTASYEARRFGVRSAMSCAKAKKLCPEAVFLPPNFEKYSATSAAIRSIFARFTDLIEPLSLDEAYLDVTDNGQGLYAVKIARLIQEAIHKELHLTGSAGVAPNKLVAKIASDMRKPFGLTVVLPEQVRDFMAPLSLRSIHGIGPVTEKRLHAVGLKTCKDVVELPYQELFQRVDSMAPWLFQASRGIDERAVETEWERKSLGREETFPVDLLTVDDLKRELLALAASVSSDLKDESKAGRTVTLKVRYQDFSSLTRRKTLATALQSADEIFQEATELLSRTEAGSRKIRLLGISLSNLEGC